MNKLNNFFVKFFFFFLLLIILAALDLAVVKALPAPINNLNLSITALVFVLFIFGARPALLASLGLGLILDFYYFPSVGINTASLFIALVLTNFLLVNVLTDKSLYSLLALTSAAYFIFSIGMYFLNYIAVFLGRTEFDIIFNRYFFTSKIYGWLFCSITAAIIFYFLNYIDKRYKPFFLVKKDR